MRRVERPSLFVAALFLTVTLLAACRQFVLVRPPGEPENLADPSLQLRQLVAQQLHVNLDEVQLLAIQPVEWPDSCLGVPEPGELCSSGSRWGHQIVLEFDGARYTYHTNDTPLQIRLAAAPPPAIGERVIEWSLQVESCNRQEMPKCQAYYGAVMELQQSVRCESAWIGSTRIAFGPCGMGVSPHHSGVDVMHFPVDPPFAVCLLLDLGEDALPDAVLTPAVEAAGDGAWWAVTFGQVLPGRSGAQDPQDAVEDAPVVFRRSARVRLLRRQEGRNLRPLFVGQLESLSHTSQYTDAVKFADKP